METHAHHLHKTPGHGWKHYLFEFLMLFLAVTLGFFVENKRERYADERRGRQYLKSFVEDLQKDTSSFSNLLEMYNEKSVVLKKLFACHDSVTGKLHSSDCMWDIIDYSLGFPDLVYTDRTLQQLKNAGGLRLLNRDDADSITAYDNLLRAAERNETTEVQEIQALLRNIAFQLINFSSVERQLTNENGSKRSEIPLIYGNNHDLLNTYFNVLLFYEGIVRNQIGNIGSLRQTAKSLITYFRDKYRLK